MRILVAVLAFPCLGTICGPGVDAPPPDDCSDPGEETVAGLAIGPERLVDRPFERWEASDTAYVTEGSQGGSMLGVSLATSGAAQLPCLAQRTEVRLGDRVLAAADHAVNTYAEAGDGTRATNTLWLVFDDDDIPPLGSELDVVSEAGGRTASARVAVVPDRHRLVALTPAEQTVNSDLLLIVDVALDAVHAPPDQSFEVEVTTEGDPEVLEVEPTQTLYGPPDSVTVRPRQLGTAQLVVRRGDQEVRSSITVE